MPRLSIAICSYNRAELLNRTLSSLVAQSGVDWRDIEIIIVDNNSTDATASTIQGYRDSLGLRYVHEPTQGLSHARNRAIAEFSSDFLLFTDDDVLLEPDWLAAFLQAVDEHPDWEIFGGRVRADWHGSKPGWVHDENLAMLRGAMVSFDLGDRNRPYDRGDEGPVGASFGFRRSLLTRMEGFNTELGQIGKQVGRGEETEFIERALRCNAKCFYVGEALLWHWVDMQRLSLAGLWRYGLAKGRAHKVMGDGKGSLSRATFDILRGLLQLAKGRGDRFRQCLINASLQVGSR